MGRSGTSACVHGKFYCKNRGYTPQLLNASMVDDGYCGETSTYQSCMVVCSLLTYEAKHALGTKAPHQRLLTAAAWDPGHSLMHAHRKNLKPTAMLCRLLRRLRREVR